MDDHDSMEFAFYSISLILSFSTIRWMTENLKFHVRNEKIWVHHWIFAAFGMMILIYLEIKSPWLWGGLTGIALEGLRRDNWSLFR